MSFDPEQEYGWYEYPAVHMRKRGAVSSPWPEFSPHGHVERAATSGATLEGAYDAILRALTEKRWDAHFDRFRDYLFEADYPGRYVRLILDVTALSAEEVMTLNNELQPISFNLRTLGAESVALQFILEVRPDFGASPDAR